MENAEEPCKTWNSVVLPINHQHCEYTQVHELIGDRKTTFCKQQLRGNIGPAFGRHSLINKLKRVNGTYKRGMETAAALTSLP